MSQAPIFPPGSGSDHPTGRGIGVAVLDTGCFPHEDYQARIAAFFDMVRRRRLPYDDNGHGTHVCGIIAGNGSASKGRFCGIAPGCHLIPVKVLDKRGGGYVSDVLAGLHLILQQRDRTEGIRGAGYRAGCGRYDLPGKESGDPGWKRRSKRTCIKGTDRVCHKAEDSGHQYHDGKGRDPV